MRKVKFANGEYYHIYNKGAADQNIFREEKDFAKFIYKMNDHNNVLNMSARLPTLGVPDTECPETRDKLVEFVCYSLAPSHYHSILKQLADQGIQKYLHKLEMSYAKYFNRKYGRIGVLFQGKFQAVHIDSNEYLLWLSGYVNGNVEIHKIAKAEEWKWSSYKDYLGLRNGTICDKEIILSQFSDTPGALDTRCQGHRVSGMSGASSYREYVQMVIENSSKRKDDLLDWAGFARHSVSGTPSVEEGET